MELSGESDSQDGTSISGNSYFINGTGKDSSDMTPSESPESSAEDSIGPNSEMIMRTVSGNSSHDALVSAAAESPEPSSEASAEPTS